MQGIQDVLNQTYGSQEIQNPPTPLPYPLDRIDSSIAPKTQNPTQNTLVGNTFHNSHSNTSNTHHTYSTISLPSFLPSIRTHVSPHTHIHSSQKKKKRPQLTHLQESRPWKRTKILAHSPSSKPPHPTSSSPTRTTASYAWKARRRAWPLGIP